MEEYDEDLSLNPFLVELQADYNNELFSQVTKENFLICVPQIRHVSALRDKEYYKDHIFRFLNCTPSGSKTLKSLAHKLVVILGTILTVHEPDGSTWENRILFEETFYPNDSQKYRVLCVERPLDHAPDICSNENQAVHSLQKCFGLLTGSDIHNLDNAITSRLASFTSCDNITQMKTYIEEILRSAWKYRQNQSEEMPIVATESYVLHKMSKYILRLLSSYNSAEDVNFNKVCRNLFLGQASDLNIEPRFYPFLPQARQEFAKFGDLTTPLSKLYCLKRTIAWFSNLTLTADDVLSILIFLIIKSPVANWIAQKSYIQQFRLSPLLNNVSEFGYYIASLEAALQHIRSNDIRLPHLMAPSPLFRYVRENNPDSLSLMLQTKILEVPRKCHPLCNCNSCISSVRDINNELDASGKSLLHHACYYGHPQVVDLLTKTPLDLDLKDLNHYTPLHHAALRGHQHAVLLLCHAGATIASEDKEHNTPLHLAAMNGHDACVKALLYFAEHVGQDIDVNAKNSVGDTALHLAAKYGYITIIETLLEHGALLETNISKMNPIDVAQNPQLAEFLGAQYSRIKETGHKKRGNHVYKEFISKFIWRSKKTAEESCKKVEKLMLAVERGDLQLACFYLGFDGKATRPMDIDVQDLHGNTPLLQAVLHNQMELARILIKRGANPNLCNQLGQSALFHASKLGQVALAELLLEGGANVNLPDYRGQTPLHVASQMGNFEVVRKLCEKKANVCKKNWRHQKALEIAQRRGHSKIIEFLIEQEIVDSAGVLPLHRPNV